MATHRAVPADTSIDFLSRFLREPELGPRCVVLAQHLGDLLPGEAVVVYAIEDQESPQWVAKAAVGEVHLEEEVVGFESGTLGNLATQRKPLLFAGKELAREEYAHLHAGRTLVSLAYVPLFADELLVGAIEIATFARALTQSDLVPLVGIADFVGQGLASAMEYERERGSHLESISRLAQLYDLEKVFNSTLEMDELLSLVASKLRQILEVQAVNVWLVKNQDELLLMSRDGDDPTLEVGASQKTGGGLAAEVSDTGEPILVSDPNDESLKERNAGVQGGAVFSCMAAPLVAQETQVGVVEAINKLDGTPFDEDDLFLLTSIAETAAGALNNAGLLKSERKVQILETLVSVSKEITSTLNMDGVLQTVVNGTKAVVPYDRAAVALEQRGRLQVKAVSGLDQIRLGDADVRRLLGLLEWATVSNDEVHVTRHEEEVDSPREETKAKFTEYFDQTGMNAFHAVPLFDDQGRVGMLSFESRDSDFLTEAHREMIRVLASQVTVALRNAELYREVPFIRVIEPLMQRKKRFMALQKRRRAALVAGAAAIAAFLLFFPLPMRLLGDATVAPQTTARIQPQIEGTVRTVHVHEGDAVQPGTVLADLEDWDYRAALASAEAKYETALADMNRALAANDGSEAGVQRVQAEYWASEVGRARERLEKTHLRSPISGVVATPHVETLVGSHLAEGDTLAEVVNTARTLVDVNIDQEEVELLKPGTTASIKLESFPTRVFKGDVVVVSPKSESVGDSRVFFARVGIANPEGRIRAGMQGRGKVWVGWRPAGYVLMRGPAMWVWSKLWSWFGW